MKLPSYNKKEEEEKKEQEQTSYKPLPRGVGRKQTEVLPAPEVSTPTFQSSVLNIFGLGDTPLDASQGRALMQTGQELMTEPEINDWAGRNEMIGEYRGLQAAQNMGATDAALPSSILARQAEQSDRMAELRKQLEQGDIAAGNGPMSYSAQDRTGSVLAGTGMNIASGLTSAAGTIGEAAGRSQRMEEEQNREQLFAPADVLGFDTDRAREAAQQASEAETANAHEKWETVRAAADQIGEEGAEALQTAKNGLSKLGQVGVDISENMIEMGFDMAVGAATGGSSLIPMFARTFGSAASEARKDGASLDEQILYGTTKAGIEVLTEKMFDGLAGVYGKGAADEITEKLIGKLAKSKEGATMLRVLFSGGGEMIEEFVSSLLDPLAKSTYQKITAPNLAGFGVTEALSAEDARALTEEMSKPGYFSNVDVSDMLYSGLVGFLIGSVGGGASIATGQNARANAELGFGTAPVEAAPEVAAPEVAPVETAPAAPEAAPAETAPAAPAQPLAQTVNRSQANKIINDPTRRAAFEEESGLTLPGRKSEAAQMVVDYYAQQAAQTETAPAETAPEAPVESAPVETPAETAPETPIVPEAPAQVTNESSPEEIANFLEQRAQAAEARGDAETAAAYRGMADAERARGMEQQTFAENPAPEAISEAPVEAAPVEPGVTMPTTETQTAPAETAPANGPISQTAESIRDYSTTPDEFRTLMNQDMEKGGFRYAPISNDTATQNAISHITEDGWTEAYSKWQQDAARGVAGADMTATGALLFNHALETNDFQLAMDIARTFAAVGTNTAQGLQMFNAIKAGMSPANQLLMVEKSCELLNKKYGLEIKLSDELKTEYVKAETDEARDAVIDKMKAEVKNQIPTKAITMKDGKPTVNWRILQSKWNALRYMNMLGNFKTQGRNLIGNTAMAGTTTAKNAVQSIIEYALNKATGGKVQRTTSLFVTDKALLSAAKADYDAHAAWVNGEGKYSDTNLTDDFARDIEEDRRVFRFLPAEWLRRATNKAMTKGDTIFIGPRYARTLAGYLQANGMSGETFAGIIDGSIQPTAEQTKLINDARNYAAKEAQEATFHDNNAFSQMVSQFGRKGGASKGFAGVLAEGLMPFRKTPANVLVRAEEYSPLGVGNTFVKGIQAMRGKATVSDVINQFSKTMTGTGLFALGMLLHNMGMARGTDDDENQENFDKQRGLQDYSLQIPADIDDLDLSYMPDDVAQKIKDVLSPLAGRNITMDWLAPSSVPFFMGVAFNQARQEEGFSGDALVDSLTNLTDPIIQMSMLQGVNNTLEDLSYADNKLERVLMNLTISYLTQGLTNSLAGQAERTYEDERYSTFVDRTRDDFLGNTQIGQNLQRQLGKMSAKTPFWDFNQVEYVDAWGRTQDTGTPLARAGSNFANPGYTSKDNSTEVDDELQRLYDTGNGNVFPERIAQSYKVSTYDSNGQKTGERNLTADEYVQFQKVMGQTSLELVKDLMNSRVYGNLTDEARAAAISDIYSYAKNLAAQKVEPSTKKEYSDVAKLSNVAAYYGIKQAISKATSNKFDRDYSALDTLMKDYSSMPADVRKLLEEKNSNVAKVHEAYQAGIKTRDYYKLTDGISNLKPAEGYANPANWQKIELISQSKLSEDQMDVMMHQYFSDGADKRYDESRAAGYTPSQLAAWYRINSLNSKKAQKLAAATEYGFTKKQAAQLYKLWN